MDGHQLVNILQKNLKEVLQVVEPLLLFGRDFTVVVELGIAEFNRDFLMGSSAIPDIVN